MSDAPSFSVAGGLLIQLCVSLRFLSVSAVRYFVRKFTAETQKTPSLRRDFQTNTDLKEAVVTFDGPPEDDVFDACAGADVVNDEKPIVGVGNHVCDDADVVDAVT